MGIGYAGHWRHPVAGVPSYGKVGGDAARVGITTVTTTASTAASLAAAAGGAAAIPVAGWIAAAGLGVAAGTVALVGAIAGGKVRKREAVAMAQSLGLPNATAVPGFLARALRWKESKLKRMLRKVNRQIERKQRHQQKSGLGKAFSALAQPAVAARSMKKLKAKRVLLKAVLQYKKTGVSPAERRAQKALEEKTAIEVQTMVPVASPPGMLQRYPALVILGGAALGVTLVAILRRRS